MIAIGRDAYTTCLAWPDQLHLRDDDEPKLPRRRRGLAVRTGPLSPSASRFSGSGHLVFSGLTAQFHGTQQLRADPTQ